VATISTRAAVITGSNGGIGRAISRRLAADGYFIYLCCHGNQAAAETVLEDIRNQGGEGEVLAFDIGNVAATEKAMAAVVESPREVAAVIHGAGVVKRSLFAQTTSDTWDTAIATNLNGFFYMLRPLLRRMIRLRDGCVIALSSVIAPRGLEGQGAYAASKSGLIGAVRSLAREVGPYNIRANIVSPGWIRAGMNQGDPPEEVKKRIPLRRAGQAEEVADLVSFLCSPRASYISGAIIPVAGGLDM
jgi:3-oxoacyl-[acyl-carrier protein] reductase